jgi:hypothetical protein
MRLPLVGDRPYRWPNKNLSKKERLKANCASRWSAVGRRVGTSKKNPLTRAGLLMEVARHSTTIGKRSATILVGVHGNPANPQEPSSISAAIEVSRLIDGWMNK